MITTPEVQARIDQQRREDTEKLARQALHFRTEYDPLTGGFIVRNPKIPGRIEVVSERGACSCRTYRLWDRCKHSALVAFRHGRG